MKLFLIWTLGLCAWSIAIGLEMDDSFKYLIFPVFVMGFIICQLLNEIFEDRRRKEFNATFKDLNQKRKATEEAVKNLIDKLEKSGKK